MAQYFAQNLKNDKKHPEKEQKSTKSKIKLQIIWVYWKIKLSLQTKIIINT